MTGVRRQTFAASIALIGLVTLAACSTDQSVRTTAARTAGADGSAPDDSIAPDTTTASDDSVVPSETTDAPDGPEQPASTIIWGPCVDESVTDDTFECGTITVPLDPTAPGGDTLDLALIRLPATDAENRVGAVLTNPGGPGGSGFDFIANAGTTLVSDMGLENFDLIGFDPRGVDRSNGLRCVSDAEFDATIYLDPTPDTPEEQAASDAADDAFEQGCIDNFGDTLVQYSTVNTAYDMDAIRAALGDEQISYLGISYGTYLGAVYATLFPERVRVLVLDAAYEPTGDSVEEQYSTQLQGFDEAFKNWATWCETTESCTFRSADVEADWDALRVQMDTTPAPAADGRLANEAVFETATYSALYSESQWPFLAQALTDARNGTGDKLFVLADSYVGREEDGSYATIQQSIGIISCASGLDPELPDDPEALAQQLRELSPRFAASVSADDFADSCAPLMPNVVAPTLSFTGDAPVLVIGGLNDPATPFRWSQEMTEKMGANARLLTFTGEGHSQTITSSCVTDWEAQAIVDLTLPDEGAICDPDPPIVKPDWWDALPVPDGIGPTIEASGVNALLGLTPALAFTESRTSELSPEEVLDAYDAALEATGWIAGDRAEPISGVPQGVYFNEDGAVFSLLVFGPDGFASPDVEGLDQVADPNLTLVVLLAF